MTQGATWQNVVCPVCGGPLRVQGGDYKAWGGLQMDAVCHACNLGMNHRQARRDEPAYAGDLFYGGAL